MQSVLLPLRTSKVVVDVHCVFLPAITAASHLLQYLMQRKLLLNLFSNSHH